MKYDYDLICVGLGPAGMAVSIMASEMGLKVCAIEKHKVGGECMNVGCIPSKALLRMAKARHIVNKYERMELAETPPAEVKKPFARIQESLDYISEKKTMGMFKKVDMVYQEGAASFVDDHTIAVGEKTYTAKRIFLCVGTRPAVPEFPGLKDVGYLTNENMFHQDSIPPRLIVLGGGAIACEMAQAFSRLGSEITMIIRGKQLMWREGSDVCDILEETFEKEGIRILREQKPQQFSKDGETIVMETTAGERVEADKVLVGAGRRMDFSKLNLEDAGVKYRDEGITVNKYLQTSRRHIYACGDCNGYRQLSHAAMHQGMIALMNSMMPWPFKRDFRRFVVPWTVFTEPQISQAGPRASALKEDGVAHEVVRVNYADYGAAIAENVDTGFVKICVSKLGRIHSATIVGEGSGEMINEWALAIQNKIRMHAVMMQQHSFPTMGFLSKRASETWMMNRMKSGFLKSMCRMMFRL